MISTVTPAPPPMISKARLAPSTGRRRRRHFVRLEGQVVRESDFRQVGTRILNMSEYGMFVATESPLEIGDGIILAFMAPFTRTWVDAEAIVTRVAHGRRSADRAVGAGLEFMDISDVSRALLREQLRGLPPPLPNSR